MKINIEITRDADDLAQDHHILTAYNLSGIADLPEGGTERKPILHPYRKAFNKLRGRSASLVDYQLAHQGVVELTRKTKLEIASMEVFSDERKNTVWREGVVQNANLAMREWISFLECTREDIDANCEAPSMLLRACLDSLGEMIESAGDHDRP